MKSITTYQNVLLVPPVCYAGLQLAPAHLGRFGAELLQGFVAGGHGAVELLDDVGRLLLLQPHLSLGLNVQVLDLEAVEAVEVHVGGQFARAQQEAQLLGPALLLEVQLEPLKMGDLLAGEELLARALELITAFRLLGFCMAVVLHAHDLRVLQVPDLLLQLLKVGLPILQLLIPPRPIAALVLGASHGQPLAVARPLSRLLVDVGLRSVAILDLPVIGLH